MKFDPRNPQQVHDAMVAKGFTAPNQHVVVLREEAEKVSAGGIIIPEAASRIVRMGVIVLVGDNVDIGVAAGDGVVLQVYEATLAEVVVGETKVVVEILHQSDVLLRWPNGKVRGAAGN